MPDQTLPPGPPDDPSEDSLVASFEADPQLKLSKEWIGVLREAGNQNRVWNGGWLAACLSVTVVLAVTHTHPIAFAVPILALLVAILTETRRPHQGFGFASPIAGGSAGPPDPALAAALDDAST